MFMLRWQGDGARVCHALDQLVERAKHAAQVVLIERDEVMYKLICDGEVWCL